MDYRNQIQFIRSQYLKGSITLDDAKTMIEPMLKDMNEQGKETAKKHGFKFKKLTFNYIFR